jgi:hypothetical protein
MITDFTEHIIAIHVEKFLPERYAKTLKVPVVPRLSLGERTRLTSGGWHRFFRNIRIYPGLISAMICSQNSRDGS